MAKASLSLVNDKEATGRACYSDPLYSRQQISLTQTGTWALPGGHLEYAESFEDCAKREVLEETGLSVQDLQFLTVTNSIPPGGHHYVTIFMGCICVEPDAQPQASFILENVIIDRL